MRAVSLTLVTVLALLCFSAGHAGAQPCDVTAQPGDIAEGEICGADTNGGCNSWFGGLPVPDVFTPAACGQSFFGSVWADVDTRDTDWYLLSHSGGDLSFTLTAELPSVNFFVAGIDTVNGVCEPVVVGPLGGSNSCTPGTITANLPAGDYVAFVATETFDGYPCDSNNSYRLSIDCTTNVTNVVIDVKFCSDPNALNCGKKGVIPVTIFGSAGVDVSDIDVSSLRLCLEDKVTCTTLEPKSYSVMDRGDPTTDLGASACAIVDGIEQRYLNPDGLDDLDVGFDAQDVVSSLFAGCAGIAKNNPTPTVVLVGALSDGSPIESVPVGDLGIDQFLKQNK